MKPADLWNWNGHVGRFAYFLTGLLAFFVKHSLDTLLAYQFGLHWHLWNYWAPVDRLPTVHASGGPQGHFLTLLFITAVPFIWIGVVLTVNRLRDAAQPLWLVLLFFIPIVNVLLFVVLCALPSQPLAHFDSPMKSVVWGFQSRVGSAALAALVAGFMGMSVTWIDLRTFGIYGLSLFVALPFVMGYLAVWLHCLSQPRSAADMVAVVFCPFYWLASVSPRLPLRASSVCLWPRPSPGFWHFVVVRLRMRFITTRLCNAQPHPVLLFF